MAKKIIKRDFNIDGMDTLSMLKQVIIYKRMPFINLFEGPRLKYLFELYVMHNLGHMMVNMEINHPRVYQVLIRIRNSLVFRYNHQRSKIARKLSKS